MGVELYKIWVSGCFFVFILFSQVLVSESFLVLFYVNEGITFHLLVSENIILVENMILL